MRIIGITGGIASGKSNVCSLIRKMGYPVIDCDEISYRLSLKGNTLHKAIIDSFGADYLLQNGEIDRKKLGKLIFTDEGKRLLLDKISHPLIMAELKNKINRLDSKLVFIEVPLLYEAGFDSICDRVICVYLPRELQIKRLIEREGIDISYARSKVASQMDLELKKAKADYVIDSSGSFLETKEKATILINTIIKEIN